MYDFTGIIDLYVLEYFRNELPYILLLNYTFNGYHVMILITLNKYYNVNNVNSDFTTIL